MLVEEVVNPLKGIDSFPLEEPLRTFLKNTLWIMKFKNRRRIKRLRKKVNLEIPSSKWLSKIRVKQHKIMGTIMIRAITVATVLMNPPIFNIQEVLVRIRNRVSRNW